jgi:hypothetical protein
MVDSAEFIEQFVANKVAYGIASDTYDYKVGNKLYDKGFKLLKKVWAMENRGVSILVGLSVHENPYVAIGAAVGLLPLDEALAIERLSQLETSENSNVAYNAQMCISEWKKGGMANIRNMT